ncbi:helix-turn-helix domain-containing protein [Bacteroides sp. 224]|uniref:helix-turn-helix domain-containing protein n=1 Tax=Bacteroides sp. 224 TaxID=2302936 RepID=UPI0013CFA076|nr:helix-turn-helix domain-containing protein [Bacteroides sp. 224]NDV64633.1 DNA-binding protein [Bacteroides sp. 224]
MEVIVMESQAYKALVGRINAIEKFIKEKKEVVNQDVPMLDTQTVCAYLKVSKRTLQRYRSNGNIAYSIIGHKTYYSIAAIKQFLKDRNIRRDCESLGELAQKGVITVPQE